MLRKTVVVSTLALLSAPCFSGLYLGGAVGPEGANYTENAHFVTTIAAHPESNINTMDENHFSGYGVFGSIFAGYGWNYNRYYLAGEINANISSVKRKHTNTEVFHAHLDTTTYTITNSEGVSVLPGFFLSEGTLLYGRAGYTNGRIKARQGDETIQSSTTNRNGVRYGLGLRHDFAEHLTLMMDYSQITYQSIKSHVLIPAAFSVKDTKTAPTSAQFAFGLIYNFDKPQKAYVK
ncbi:MAG: outer membrane beta-barrel protein [Legionella sp.]|nr:outer membrane beta-barrel protein [Legionella sp.]